VTRRGALQRWVETAAPADTSRRHADTIHPRHLVDTALALFLMQKLGLRESVPGALARTLCLRYFLLPSAAGAPLPSFELLRYVDEVFTSACGERVEFSLTSACGGEEEVPTEFELAPWQVCCYRVPQVITALS